MFQSIIYGLGFEELLGGKNEKTMQSVLKDQVEFPRGIKHNINQSFIYLEIENKEIITIKRSVASSSRKAQLVDVYFEVIEFIAQRCTFSFEDLLFASCSGLLILLFLLIFLFFLFFLQRPLKMKRMSKHRQPM